MAQDPRVDPSTTSFTKGMAALDEDWTQLRSLLLAPEQTQLDEIRERLDHLVVHARDISRVLPEAVALRGEKDPPLSSALAPYVEHGFVSVVHKSPRVIVDAIAPIMGPAIRQAIVRTLQNMMQSFNQTMEESLSIRGLRWRLEAWRTGRPFAEVVLLKTLRYRVEQVFLVHRETGLLLHHVATDRAVLQDQQVLSGMLTAIQQYVRDSFGASQDHTLDQFHVGDWTVWIEQGSYAYLAGVIRGTPPEGLREDFRSVLDDMHAQYVEALKSFTGDAAPFQTTQAHLESCLQAHYEAPPRPSALKLWILVGAVLLACSWWGVTAYQTHARWSHLLAALRSEPGIVITKAEVTWGGYHLEGLRDPSANDPAVKIVEAGLDAESMMVAWSPYYSLEPTFIEARAHSLLQPPETVHLNLEGHTLVATGSAPTEWAKETRRLAVLVPGVSHYRDDGLITTTRSALLDRINRTMIHFRAGSSTVEPAERATLSMVSETLRDLDQAASQSGQRLQLDILGAADNTGSVTRNIQLSKERAEAVLEALQGSLLSGATRVITGVVPSMTQLEFQDESSRQRVVILRASFVAAAPGPEAVRP